MIKSHLYIWNKKKLQIIVFDSILNECGFVAGSIDFILHIVNKKSSVEKKGCFFVCKKMSLDPLDQKINVHTPEVQWVTEKKQPSSLKSSCGGHHVAGRCAEGFHLRPRGC